MLSPRTVRALAACAVAVALTALPAAAAGPATAAPAQTAARFPSLPPIGAEVPSSVLAVGSLFEYRRAAYTVDFKGGIKQRVEVNPNDPINSVRLRTVGFRVSAELPGGGRITLEQNDVDVDPKSILRLVSHFPPRFDEHDVIPVSATVELPGKETIVLDGNRAAASERHRPHPVPRQGRSLSAGQGRRLRRIRPARHRRGSTGHLRLQARRPVNHPAPRGRRPSLSGRPSPPGPAPTGTGGCRGSGGSRRTHAGTQAPASRNAPPPSPPAAPERPGFPDGSTVGSARAPERGRDRLSVLGGRLPGVIESKAKADLLHYLRAPAKPCCGSSTASRSTTSVVR